MKSDEKFNARLNESLTLQLQHNHKIITGFSTINKVYDVVIPESFSKTDFMINLSLACTGRVSFGSDSLFWKSLAAKNSLDLEHVYFSSLPVRTGGPTVVYYSGGLESSVLATSFMGDCLFIRLTNIEAICNSLRIKWIEPVLIFAAKELFNADNVVIGDEYSGTDLYTEDLFFSSSLVNKKIAEYCEINSIHPVQWIEKYSLYKEAINRGIKFSSCCNKTEGKDWCGNCFKCFQIATFGYCYDTYHKDMIKAFDKVLAKKYVDQVNDTILNRLPDPFYGDNISFVTPLAESNTSLKEIWGV
jgi:hypothetical protein